MGRARAALVGVVAATTVVGAVALAVPSAGAATGTFTWSGTDANTGTNLGWSDANNWAGGVSPTGSVSSIAFPATSACPATTPSTTPCDSEVDETVSTNSLTVAGDYLLGGTDVLTVGSGGVTASAGEAILDVPLTLSGTQTWSVGAGASLQLFASASGSGPLTVDLQGQSSNDVATLGLTSAGPTVDAEVGPVTFAGTSAISSGVLLSPAGGPVDLDATDGSTVTVSDALLGGAGTTGPLVVKGGALEVGNPVLSAAGDLDVNGAVTLDGQSVLLTTVLDNGDTAGTDYGELVSTGAVDLGGAGLGIGLTAASCQVPALGATYTVVSASGGISGTVTSPSGGAVANGGTVPVLPASGCSATGEDAQIEYNTTASPATVTAKVVSAASASASTTTVAASATSVAPGKAVTYTATVTPTPAGGTVAFADGGKPIAGCTAQPVSTSGSTAGQATCTVTYSAAGTHVVTATFSGNGSQPGSASAAVTVTVTSGSGSGSGTSPPTTSTIGQGYAEVTSDGWVYVFGAARSFGSLPSDGVHTDDVVGIAPTADGGGYWLVGADGGVFGFGDAGYHGSLPADGVHVADIVGMQPTADGGGYWLVGSDGGVFGFGDAGYHGSLPADGVHVGDIVGIASSADGGGYWLVGSDGGVFAFGDAPYLGAASAVDSSDRVVALVPTPSGNGYWEIGEDGGVFSYGDAQYLGSLPGFGVRTDTVVAATR